MMLSSALFDGLLAFSRVFVCRAGADHVPQFQARTLHSFGHDFGGLLLIVDLAAISHRGAMK